MKPNKTTSPKIAKIASRALKSRATSTTTKKLAGSALSQKVSRKSSK